MFFMGKRQILQHNNNMCVHTPTEEKDEIQKDDFYEDLERIYMKHPNMISKL
jgi:hypothetical protein